MIISSVILQYFVDVQYGGQVDHFHDDIYACVPLTSHVSFQKKGEPSNQGESTHKQSDK